MGVRFYLETSTVRALGGKIRNLKDDREYFTSALSLVELLSAAQGSDRSYRAAKQILLAIEERKIPIDWTLPEGKLGNSFDYLLHKEMRASDLAKIAETLRESDDHASFLKKEQDANLKYGLGFLCHYDNSFGIQFTKATIAGNKDIKDTISKQKGDSIFPQEELDLPIKDFCKLLNSKYFELNKSLSVWAIAGVMATWIEDPVTDETTAKIYNSYNWQTERHIIAYTYYCTEKTGTQDQPGRNDHLDLSHFMYLGWDDILVSNDKDMITLGNTLWPGSVVTPDALPLD